MGGFITNLPTVFGANLPNPLDLVQKYYPPNWTDQKALYAITYQGGAQSQDRPSIIDGPGYNNQTDTYMFVFDGIRRAHHRQTATPTTHPVQAGYNITDHVILQPSTLQLEVLMTDALAMYAMAGFKKMWSDDRSKSVAAYQRMKILMAKRIVMTVNTRLNVYNNMILVDIASEDSARTYFGGLFMTLQFQEIFVADVATTTNAVRLQSYGETQLGDVQTQTPDQTTIDQHKIDPIQAITGIPAAGLWDSVRIGIEDGLSGVFPTLPLPFKKKSWIRSYR